MWLVLKCFINKAAADETINKQLIFMGAKLIIDL